jgi:hypothetical protein
MDKVQGVAGRRSRCAGEDRQQVCDLPHVRSGRCNAILNLPKRLPKWPRG